MSTNPLPQPTAAAVIIGNEILSGRTVEGNLNYLAKKLGAKGIHLAEARLIEDDEAMIMATLNELRRRYDYVFTSGGIGPTHDDITALAVAKTFGVELRPDPRAVAILTAHYPPGGLTPARAKMTEIPVGAELIPNPVSKAPGFSLGNVHVMAGVPDIFRAMVDELLPNLAGGAVTLAQTITCAIGESFIAAELAAIQKDFPDVQMGSYPFYRPPSQTGSGSSGDGSSSSSPFGTALVLRSTDAARLDQARDALGASLTAQKIPFTVEPRT
ncbi:MAG: molybdopterin-binding protein [Candidatus Symbiobacter sp.]|nr:molybdopterin-binding protein [Candidatus Symbiobacter sp.]